MIPAREKKKLILAVREDVGKGDSTSSVTPLKKCTASVYSKQDCLLAGAEEAVFLFNHFKVDARLLKKDGAKVKKGEKIIALSGNNHSILKLERTAMNFLGRMSGVASSASLAQSKLGKKTRVALTRKTAPLLNYFDKKAAVIAGVWPHRENLSDGVLFKENHLLFFDSPAQAIEKARKKFGRKKKFIEVEVSSIEEALEAATAKPDIIMLDNFSLAEIKKAIPLIKKECNAKIEISGGVTMKNISKYNGVEADIVSMGSLTHSVNGIDFSLLVEVVIE